MELNLISLKVEEEQFNHCSGLKALFFYTVHEVLTASILGWFAIPSSSGSCLVRILHYAPSVLGAPARHGL